MPIFLDVKDLDKLFSLFLDKEKFIDPALRGDFKTIILQYFEFFKKLPPEYYEIKKYRHFELTVFETDYFYTLCWSESRLIEIANKNRHHQRSISVSDNDFLLDEEILVKVNAAKTFPLSSNPIILGDVFCIFPDRHYYILDGNHRFSVAVKSKENFINAIVLEPHLHIQAIENKYIRTLYKIHHNRMLTIMLFMKSASAKMAANNLLAIKQFKDPLLNYTNNVL